MGEDCGAADCRRSVNPSCTTSASSNDTNIERRRCILPTHTQPATQGLARRLAETACVPSTATVRVCQAVGAVFGARDPACEDPRG
jgi:hypothetical protein